MRYLFLALIFLLFFNSYGTEGYFKVINKKLMKELVTMKVTEIDTIKGWVNYYNSRSQTEYIYRMQRAFQWLINSDYRYEVLDDESKIEPDIKVYLKISDIYIESKNLPPELIEDRTSEYGNVKRACEITLEGISSKTGEKIFETRYFDDSIHLDERKDNELLEIFMKLMREIGDNFSNISVGSRLKTYQKYNFNCAMVDTIHFYFSNSMKIESAERLYGMASAEINQRAMDADVNIFQIYSDSTTSIISEKNISYDGPDNFLTDSLQRYLKEKGIKSLLLFSNLKYSLPLKYFDENEGSPAIYSSNFITGIGFSVIKIDDGDDGLGYETVKIGQIRNPSIELNLIDVSKNKCLISTILYSYSNLGRSALESIGVLNEENGEVEGCYDFDYD